MQRSEQGWTEDTYAGGALDALWKTYAYHTDYSGAGQSYGYTEADKEAEKTLGAFVDADSDTFDKAHAVGHAARRAGYFAGWKDAALLFMDIMTLINADTDGIRARERKAAGFVKRRKGKT